jgi:hypothetical protein
MVRTISQAARVLIAGAAIAAGAVAAAGAAAAATPTYQDRQFLDQLSRYGIEVVKPDVAVNNAHLVCTKLTQGESAAQIVKELGTAENQLTPKQVAEYAGTAVGVYCDELASALS